VTLQTLRDIMVTVAAMLVSVVIVVATTNREEVARWKIDVDQYYWNMYEQRCVVAPNDCMGD
jgi:hypothetical protein